MSTLKKARRLAGRMLVTAVAVGAVVTGVVAVDRARPDEAVVAADPLQVATAERTDMSVDATLDGAVESSSTMTVLHRIEGATPSTASSTTGSGSTTESAPPAGGFTQGVAFVQLEASSLVETATTSAETTVPDSTTTPPTTEPATTAPDTTVPTTSTPPVATTAPATSEPATSEPATTTPGPDTAPDDCATPDTTTTMDPSTTTSTPTDPPTSTTVPSTCTTVPVDTSVPGGGAPAGGLPGGGAPGGGISGGGAGGSSVSGSGTTTSITERVTSLPAVGATIELGDVLYTVDGEPVIALTGSLPAWRSLSTSSDDGPDIAQLELSLAALGYDADGSLVVDDEYDSATAEAVEAWQTGLGRDATGEVELGDVVFLPSTVTVTELDTTVGADVTEADQILHVSGSAQQVVAAVTDDVESVVVPGLQVQLVTDAGLVAGVVTLLRSVAADDGTVTVEAVITPTTEMAAQANGSTVDVTIAIDGPTDAITVPADAIVSRLDGTYAVEVRDDTGDHWVTVEVIDVRGSTVAVAGIDAGTQVLVPA
jgi:hypothetical protein